MPAHALSIDRTISSTSQSTPPIHVSRSSFSEGERIVLRQAGAFVSIPLNDLDKVIAATLLASVEA